MAEENLTPKDATKVPDEDEDEKYRFKLNFFRGVPFPKSPFDMENLEKVVEFKPDPDDIFVVTYPKCGTTWTQYIVWEIINEGAPPPPPNKMMFFQFPFLELTEIDRLDELEKPRLMKTHLPFQLQPYNPLTKYIYVVRNPWDVCVSFYHHMQIDFPDDDKQPFHIFFDCFVQGQVPWGDYFDHVLSWFAHKDDPNILFLNYEDMKADPKGTILKVAKFLGDQYYNVLAKDEEVLNNCLKHTNFYYMKDMKMFLPKDMVNNDPSKVISKDVMKEAMKVLATIDKDNVDLEKFKEWDFFRKGIVGDWKNYFTESQIERFYEYINSKLSGSGMEHMWLSESTL